MKEICNQVHRELEGLYSTSMVLVGVRKVCKPHYCGKTCWRRNYLSNFTIDQNEIISHYLSQVQRERCMKCKLSVIFLIFSLVQCGLTCNINDLGSGINLNSTNFLIMLVNYR